MHWSLSEFLNLVEFRGQNWCFVDMAARSGVGIGHSESVLMHAVLDGTIRLSRSSGENEEYRAGDIVLVLSGDAHTIRNPNCASTQVVELLNSDGYVDAPQTVGIGEGLADVRMVSGRLKVRWPGGSRPRGLPPVLVVRSGELGIDFRKFSAEAKGPGGSALLTQTACALFISAFRREPRCRALFQWDLGDPIARAQVLIEKHPFRPWTVDALAKKVGMGRSNFAARFAEETGVTPIDSLTVVRMRVAEDLLRTTQLKVAEISERIGYRSEGAFIRRFTTHFGVTPGRFRRRAEAVAEP